MYKRYDISPKNLHTVTDLPDTLLPAPINTIKGKRTIIIVDSYILFIHILSLKKKKAFTHKSIGVMIVFLS